MLKGFLGVHIYIYILYVYVRVWSIIIMDTCTLKLSPWLQPAMTFLAWGRSVELARFYLRE